MSIQIKNLPLENQFSEPLPRPQTPQAVVPSFNKPARGFRARYSVREAKKVRGSSIMSSRLLVLCALALCASVVAAEVYFEEKFNDGELHLSSLLHSVWFLLEGGWDWFARLRACKPAQNDPFQSVIMML